MNRAVRKKVIHLYSSTGKRFEQMEVLVVLAK